MTIVPESVARDEPARDSNSYSIFMVVLTVISLAIMVLLILPLDSATLDLLRFYDNLICVVFLIDFAAHLAASRPKRDYFITRRGWLDLIGSVPSFGFFPASELAPRSPSLSTPLGNSSPISIPRARQRAPITSSLSRV